MSKSKPFDQDETGNTTVDWSVIAAIVVSLSIVGVLTVGSGVYSVADTTSASAQQHAHN